MNPNDYHAKERKAAQVKGRREKVCKGKREEEEAHATACKETHDRKERAFDPNPDLALTRMITSWHLAI